MEELVEAFQIFLKYGKDIKYPTHCEHDVMHVNVSPDLVSEDDIARLDELGFHVSEEWGEAHFKSFRFGSA